MDLNLWLVLWSMFALFCGGVIKGTLGMGTPLLTVPMLALLLPVQTSITLMCMPILVANVIQALQAPRGLKVFKDHWPTAMGIIVGSLIGVFLLAALDERPLLITVGCAVIIFTLVQASGFRFYLPTQMLRIAGIAAGLSAGIIGGVSSMFGPILVIYLMSIRDLDKDRFVAIVSFFYLFK